MNSPKFGDLVVTPDGYFAIVTNTRQRCVFQANGCERYFDDFSEWARFEVLPLNRHLEAADNPQPANFAELVDTLKMRIRPVSDDDSGCPARYPETLPYSLSNKPEPASSQPVEKPAN
jgi:hypothetical protein